MTNYYKNPTISVIIPMYNSEKTIISCIGSVLNQTYNDYEILVMDDGSTDKSYDIVKKFILNKGFNKKIYLYKQKNSGPSIARNELILKSRGKYIAFLDSDDEWDKNKLEEQMKVMISDENIKLVATQINGIYNSMYSYKEEIVFNKLLFKNFFSTPSVLIEKSILNNIGMFNIEKKYSEDYDLWLRIAYNYKCVLINKSFVLCGKGKPVFGYSGLSSKLKEMELGELSNYKNLYELKYINTTKYIFASIYSYLKYIRRLIIVKLR